MRLHHLFHLSLIITRQFTLLQPQISATVSLYESYNYMASHNQQTS